MEKMKYTLKLSILLLSFSSIAQAADVDYTGLEKVFGEPVTMSATGKPQRSSETPVSMEIITADQIRNSGALDIPQVLQGFAGIDVSRNFKSHADVNIRGYNQPLSNRLLVLINNRQVYMDTYGMTLWDSFPIQMSEIKQIEVVRGPNTSLFGFNAASGVVNIVTFNPLYDDVKNVQVRGGNSRHGEVGGVATIKPIDEMAVRVSAGKLSSDDYSRKKMEPRVSSKDATEKGNLNVDGVYKITDNSSLRLELGVNESKSDGLLPFYYSLNLDTGARTYRAEYTYDAHDFGLWTAQVYRNDTDMFIDARRFSADLVLPTINNVLNVGQLSVLVSPFEGHTFRIGGEYRNNYMSGDEVGSTGDKRFTMNVASGSIMWDWKIMDNLSFTNSLRYDHWMTERDGDISAVHATNYLKLTKDKYKRKEDEYSFNSALLYKATQDASFRLGAARGLHVPSLIELARTSTVPFIAPLLPQSVIPNYGNPDLKTEINTTVEVGYDQKLPDLNSSITLNVFHENIKDVISTNVFGLTDWAVLGGSNSYPAEFTFINAGKSNAWGTEFMLKGKFYENKFNWAANHTYVIIEDTKNDKKYSRIDFKKMQPRHKVNLLLGYMEDPFEANISMNYISKATYDARIGSPANPDQIRKIKAYYILNAHLGYKVFDNTRVMLDGFNLTGKHRERPAFAPPSASGDGTLAANEIGTTYLVTLKQSF